MIKTSKASGAILYVSLLAFFLFAVYILYLNQEVLYTAHERSEFIYGAPFFHTLMSKPFGLMRYVGAWLTQLFYYPALGAAVQIAIWALIFFVGIRAFRLKGNTVALMLLPVACLLTSIVDLGYWIYINSIRGYWFSQSVGYLIILLLFWAARNTPRKWHLAWYLIAFCLYPVLGWFALLFVLCLVFTEKLTWREFLGFVLMLFTASIWHTLLYSDLKFDDVILAGFPHFMTPSDMTKRLSIPFWILGAFSILMSARFGDWSFSRLENWSFSRLAVPVLSAVAGIIFTLSLMYYDQNYIDEMRMVRHAEDDNWKEILRMAEENPRPTRTMIFLKNIALMNEGGLLDRSFKLGNDAAQLNNSDSLHVTLFEIASPLVYYNYGMLNEAIRLSYENGIQYGFSPFLLKALSRSTLATGEKELMKRFTAILHHHPFYGDWQPAQVTANIKELQKAYPDELTGVENSDSYIINIVSLWNETDSKVASEQALFYAMLRCDSRRFWPALHNYVKLHMNEEFPVHAQESYILYMDKAPEEKRMMLPVEQTVYDRYNQFWATLEKLAKSGMDIEKIAEELRKDYGDTYWWYNLFGRKYFIPNGNYHSEVQS